MKNENGRKNNFVKIRRLSRWIGFFIVHHEKISTKQNSRVFITHLKSIIIPTPTDCVCAAFPLFIPFPVYSFSPLFRKKQKFQMVAK